MGTPGEELVLIPFSLSLFSPPGALTFEPQFSRNRQGSLAREGGVLSVHSGYGDRVPGLAHRFLCLKVNSGFPRLPLGF